MTIQWRTIADNKGEKVKDIYPIVIFLLAYLVRIVVLYVFKEELFFRYFSGEALFYDYWGKRIAGGDILAGRSVYPAPPLIMYYLGVLHWVSGNNVGLIRVTGAFFDAVNCGLLYLIGIYVFNRRVALVAGLTGVLYGVFIFYELMMPGTSFVIFLVLISFYMILRSIREGKTIKTWFFGGLLTGLAALGRPNILVILLPLTIWCFRKIGFTGLKKMAAFVTGVLLMIMIVFWRNYYVTKEITFIPNYGIAAFLGYNPNADGTYGYVPFVKGDLLQLDVGDFKKEAQRQTGKEMNTSQVSFYWFSTAVKFILNNPLKSMELLFRKIQLFWGGFETPDGFSYRCFRTVYPAFYFPFLSFAAVSAPSLIGIHKAWKYSEQAKFMVLFSLLQFLSVVLLFVVGRYRLPVVPFLIIIAAYFWDTLFLTMQKRNFRAGFFEILLFGILFIVTNFLIPGHEYRMEKAMYYGNLAVLYEQVPDYHGAIRCYKKAIECAPEISNNYTAAADLIIKEDGPEAAQAWFKEILRTPGVPETVFQEVMHYQGTQ